MHSLPHHIQRTGHPRRWFGLHQIRQEKDIEKMTCAFLNCLLLFSWRYRSWTYHIKAWDPYPATKTATVTTECNPYWRWRFMGNQRCSDAKKLPRLRSISWYFNISKICMICSHILTRRFFKWPERSESFDKLREPESPLIILCKS